MSDESRWSPYAADPVGGFIARDGGSPPAVAAHAGGSSALYARQPVRRRPRAPAPLGRVHTSPPPVPMPTIAVVEDNEDNRFVIAMMVGDIGEIAEYASGPAALAAFESAAPDLVLLDIALPGMDGVEVVRRMRAASATRAVPVIALTAHAMRGDRERYLAAGCDGYVSKPIEDLEEFRALVQSFVARAAA